MGGDETLNRLISRSLTLILVLAAVVALLLLAGSGLYTELLWFASVDALPVWLRQVAWRYGLRLGATLVGATFVYVNLALARRQLARAVLRWQERVHFPFSWAMVNRLLVLLALALGFIYAGPVAAAWERVALYLHRSPFGVVDPLFGKDVSFFVFDLPVYRLVQAALTGLLVLGGLVTALIYLFSGALRWEGRLVLEQQAKVHLAVLLAGLLLLQAAGYLFDMWELVYSPRGAVFGASYTDVHVMLPVQRVMAVVAILSAAAVLFNLLRPGLVYLAAGLVVLVAASFAGSAVAGLVQRFVVNPNELERERPFIADNIRYTRLGFGLDQVRSVEFSPSDRLSPEVVQANADVLRNIRLWDWRPLASAYSQLQEIRLYYDFLEVDVDRYRIDGELRQMTLSARELSPEKLQNRTWINQRLQYTHGYGLVMSPANAVTEEGLPVLVLSDIPPRSRIGIEVTRPEIYFGEKQADWVVVASREPEFDYPRGEENAFARYQGTGGVSLSNLLVRAAFALRMGDTNLLISNRIGPESRIQFVRNIRDRVERIAPFFRYDRDPYLVLTDEGRLVWILDGYTMSDRYPYSQPVMVAPWRAQVNYVRNSVKATVDAYDGTVRFYVADPDDPIVRAYAGLFPELLKPLDAMPASLRAHLRYPEDLFTLQAEVYRAYHMDSPTVFYNQEDLWEIPSEIVGEQSARMDPYYAMLRLADSERVEFVLMLPFVPRGKQNMVGWLAARMDEPHYGELVVYEFPKDRLTYGPQQIEARINQDPEISQQLTLWGQRGSRVVRGNLLVIPVGDTLLYVEPLFLESEQTQLPELRRVLVAHGSSVVMEPTFDLALARLMGQSVPATPPEGAGRAAQQGALPGEQAPLVREQLSPQAAERIRQAVQAYERAQQRLRAGDLAGYAQAIDEVGRLLRALLPEPQPSSETPPGQADREQRQM